MRMSRIRIVASLAVLVAALVVAGCGKNGVPTSSVATVASGTGTTSTTAGTAYDATAEMQVADSLAGEPYGKCPWFGLPRGIPSGCPYDAATLSFVCGADIMPDGLTRTHSYQFLDATSAPQTAYDSLATASIHFVSSLTGTTTSGPWMSVDESRDLVESGLLGLETTRAWNGTGNAARQDSVRLTDGTRVLLERSIATRVEDVVVPVPWTHDTYPLSGSILTHLIATGNGKVVDQTSTLSFNGTRYATLAVGDTTYTVDLQRPPHGPRGGPCGDTPPDSTSHGGTPPDSSSQGGRHHRHP